MAYVLRVNCAASITKLTGDRLPKMEQIYTINHDAIIERGPLMLGREFTKQELDLIIDNLRVKFAKNLHGLIESAIVETVEEAKEGE